MPKRRKTTEKTLGHELKKARNQQKLTREQVARKVGMKPAYIEGIENGEITDVPADLLSALARAVGKTVVELKPPTPTSRGEGYL